MTTSFHPRSNGMIEWFHRFLKSALRSQLAALDWFLHLPLVLLGLRTILKDDTGLSVSEAVYGSPLTILGEFLGSMELPLSSFLGKMRTMLLDCCLSATSCATFSASTASACFVDSRFGLGLRGCFHSLFGSLVPWAIYI